MGSKQIWVMGVDPSVRSTGLALFNVNTEKLETFNVVRAQEKELIHHVFKRLIKETSVAAVRSMPMFGVIEYPANAFNNIDVFEVSAVIRATMMDLLNCPLMYVSSLTIRKALVGRGIQDKEEYLTEFRKRFSRFLTNSQTVDEQEAVGMALLAADICRKMYFKRRLYVHDVPKDLLARARYVMGHGKRPKGTKGRRLIV